MSLSALGVALLVQGIPYLVLTIIAAYQLFRAPGPLRLAILLVFSSVTCSLLAKDVARLLSARQADANMTMLYRLMLVSSLLSVYAVFLFTSALTRLSRRVVWLVTGLLLLSSASTLTAFPSLASASDSALMSQWSFFQPFTLLVLLVSYLLLVIRLWQQSTAALGAIRARLRWISTGITLIFGCFILISLELFFPASQEVLTWLQSLLFPAAGILLLCGAAPPLWLRRLWLLPELERASQFTRHVPPFPQQDDAPASTEYQTAFLRQMLQWAMNGLGARAGIAELWNEQAGALEIAASFLLAEEGLRLNAKTEYSAAMAEAFNSRLALVRPISRRECQFMHEQISAGTLLVAPLLAEEKALGVMGLCCEYLPGLTRDDLAMLQLFADQIARWLARRHYHQELAALEAARTEHTLKDEFVALVAHDLRTPLTVLKGRMQLLQRQLLKEGQPAAAEAIARLDAPYNRLSQLISTLLDVSYIDTDRLQLIPHAVDLAGVVRKVVEGADHGRAVEMEIAGRSGQPGDAEPFIVLADASRLEQVLGNLLDNAYKYSPVESTITVRLERRSAANEALVSVRDAGIGIPLADQPRLFERWFRAANSPAHHYSGMGLGLYLSREIMTRHGGQIWVTSNGVPGEGSTFFFTLPMLRPDEVGNR